MAPGTANIAVVVGVGVGVSDIATTGDSPVVGVDDAGPRLTRTSPEFASNATPRAQHASKNNSAPIPIKTVTLFIYSFLSFKELLPRPSKAKILIYGTFPQIQILTLITFFSICQYRFDR